MNNKGSIQDLILIAVVLLFAAITILIGFKVMTEINDNLQTSSVLETYDTDSHARTASSTLAGYFPGIIDNSFLLLAIGLAMITLVLAALVRVHPMFIALFFIGLLIVIFVSGVLSNIYQEMAATTQLSSQATQLVFISHILEYLPLFIGIFGFILMAVMYKLWKNEEY